MNPIGGAMCFPRRWRLSSNYLVVQHSQVPSCPMAAIASRVVTNVWARPGAMK